MKRFFLFTVNVIKSFFRHNLHIYAGDMTFKLLLSFFPLMVVAIALIGFLGLDDELLTGFASGIASVLPYEVTEVASAFASEVLNEATAAGTTAILSFSAAIALYNASSGFASVLMGINNCYGQKDTRSFFKRRVLGILLALMFIGIVALVMAFMVLGSGIWRFLLALLAIFAIIALIYKIGNCKKVGFITVLPGTAVAATAWVVLSFLFNVFVKNFTDFAVLYGSLGSVFVMIVWLNFITMALLAGAELNGQLYHIFADKIKETRKLA